MSEFGDGDSSRDGPPREQPELEGGSWDMIALAILVILVLFGAVCLLVFNF